MLSSEYEAFIRAEAARRGISPDVAVWVANSEGGVTEPARRGTFATGSSWWAYQLHYGGAGYEHLGNVAGMGNDFTRVTGWQPGDPSAWRDAARWALDLARAGGWGPWDGAKAIGVTGFYGIDRAADWSGTPDDEWDYKQRGKVMLPYNPDAPCDLQPDDWSCSIQAVQWLLRSIGRNPDASNPVADPWLRSELVPRIVSEQNGLNDASGQQMAAWLNETYGREMGITFQASPVEFDDVAAGAGVNPMMCGGRRYGPGGHWVGIRRLLHEAFDLANPAPGYDGTGPTLDRAEWDARGPWSCIWVDRMSTLEPPPPPPPASPKMTLAELRDGIRAILEQTDEQHAGKSIRRDLSGLYDRSA